MKHLRLFHEAKDSISLGRHGVLIVNSSFTLRFKYDGATYEFDFEKDEFVKYTIQKGDDHIRLDNGEGIYLEISQFKRYLNRFNFVDVSKPYKLEYEGRTEYYNTSGELDRENGPAIEYEDGSKYYFRNGKLHREDGPAQIDTASGKSTYFLNGKEVKKRDFDGLLKPKTDISEEELKDLISDLADESEESEITYNAKLKKWRVIFTDIKMVNVYQPLSELNGRLSDLGYNLLADYNGEYLKLTIQ